MSLYIQEQSFELDADRERKWMFYDSEIQESYFDTPSEVYHYGVKEWGRCTGKVYIDTTEGIKPVGWVFLKKDHYGDTHEPYLRETWVTVYERPPSTIYHYQYI